jgi:hypothetical protein
MLPDSHDIAPENDRPAQRRVIHVPSTIVEGETPSYSDTDVARFWAKVRRTDGCWLWTGATFRRNGYGSFSVARGLSRGQQPPRYAHRFAWELTNGPIPAGQHCLHVCDTPPCCNPSHLFLGTHRNNMEDAARKGRLHVSRPKRQRVSDEDVAKIGPLRAYGMTLQGIADIIGATKTFVSLVLRGKRRQHPQPRKRTA